MNAFRRPPEMDEEVIQIVRRLSEPLNRYEDINPFLDELSDVRLVLLGEASHGTSEFYTWRAHISRRLIEQHGFSFVAVEGDWPDCYQINRYVKGYDDAGGSALEVLRQFDRWPTWMWANWEVAAFAEWLREYNARQPVNRKAGFFGLDVYSLWESMEEILGYLEEKAPEAAHLAYEAYHCFEPYGREGQNYAFGTRMVPETCEDEVVELLKRLRQDSELFRKDTEGSFNAEQNALVMVDAEKYYRTMVRSDSGSWNVRDRHMMDTVDRLLDYHGEGSKGIVWAHNTHIGDAQFTGMAQAGMYNLGQLARQQHGDRQVALIGFGTHRGSVIAGGHWGGPMERMPVPAARAGSWEDVLHQSGEADFLLRLQKARKDRHLEETHGNRAIGVVYAPEYESFGNYVPTVLSRRYDAMLYLHQTEALHPLHIRPDGEKTPEAYPWGF